jgi:hypothetical protein
MLTILKNGDAVDLKLAVTIVARDKEPSLPGSQPWVGINIPMKGWTATHNLNFETYAEARAYRDELVREANRLRAEAVTS